MLFRSQLLTTYTWTSDVAQGVQTASESLELTGVPTPLYDISIRVDGGDEDASGGDISECHEDNNTTEWGEFICP